MALPFCLISHNAASSGAAFSFMRIIMTKESETWNPADRWESHPKYPMSDWRYEVINGDTVLGYVEWVNHKLEDHLNDMEIVTMFVLSTGHISRETSDWLTEDAKKNVESVSDPGGPLGVLNTMNGSYGWIVNSPEDNAYRKELNIPDDLKKVLDFAASMGCAYVYFDRDGEVYDELPTYEW